MKEYIAEFDACIEFEVEYRFPSDFDYENAIKSGSLVHPEISEATEFFGPNRERLLSAEFDIDSIDYTDLYVNDKEYGEEEDDGEDEDVDEDEDEDENNVRASGFCYFSGTVGFLAENDEEAENFHKTREFRWEPTLDIFCNRDYLAAYWLEDIENLSVSFDSCEIKAVDEEEDETDE